MDTKNLIEYLTMISNNNLYLNFGMHLFIIASLVLIFRLKNAKQRIDVIEGMMLVLFMSVTINAVIFGNPFHAITFGIMTITQGYLFANRKKETGMVWDFRLNFRTVMAFLFIVLGLWYPELVKANMIESLLISPVGVIPCPTLITALGFLNLLFPYINKKQFLVTVFFGIVYGLIGTFKLGVHFDVVLIGATLFSLFIFITDKEYRSKRRA